MLKPQSGNLPLTGERFVPKESGNIVIEYVYRYLIASNLVAEKTILDIACGEGYGSDLLASTASRVIGIDTSQAAIEYASDRYKRSNLEFKTGKCANIPIPDSSVDVIVSFQTIDNPEQSFVEFKRVLRTGGTLIISTPDKIHNSESRDYVNEFRALIQRHFTNVLYHNQRVIFDSAILTTPQSKMTPNYLYSDNEIHEAVSVAEPDHHVAFASDLPVVTLSTGMLEQPINESEIIHSCARTIVERDNEIGDLHKKIKLNYQKEKTIKQLLSKAESALAREERKNRELQKLNHTLTESSSWKLTAPLRAARRYADKMSSSVSLGKGVSLLTRAQNALRYILRGDIKGLSGRLKFYRRQKTVLNVHNRLAARDGQIWGILTTPHTLFIARIIAERLESHGISYEIITAPPAIFDHDFYIVLCAQIFDKLPASEKRIVFQLEQSVSSRWFTPAYLDVLENSLAVLEYSLENIEFLAKKGISYPQMHYLPIGASVKEPILPSPSEKKYDFIFYGDSLSSSRRRKMLKTLESKFTVKICNDVFGDEMAQLIRQARAVINIHYYENALLEMPRIQECISLGVPILSENSTDQLEYPELGGAVWFFDEGSEDHMLETATNMLKELTVAPSQIIEVAELGARRFTFMFDRFLAALGVLPAMDILKTPIFLTQESNFIGLSLPETINRRKVFLDHKPDNCAVFDGIRNTRGWIGCGSSFSALARYALANNMQQLTVIEDDALLPYDFEENIQIVKEYLQIRSERWDIFSGMMASVHSDARVLSVDVWRGIKFITIDRMTSTVCNIYDRRALELLSEWDPMDLNVDKNTIDRYLEGQDNLRVVVALPFIAGHREEVESTLWGFENERYSPMIAEAESRIKELSEEWIRRQS